MATSTERPYDNVTIRSPQPIPSPSSRSTPVVERVEERSTVLAPTGPRVRWGGVMSGFVVALGALMLLTALGLAIGLTALDHGKRT
jgi:hypothetical protein